MNLIISTIQKNSPLTLDIQTHLANQGRSFELIETQDLKISHCIGCNDCWIKTPGICCIKDDYEQLFIKILQADQVLFISDTKLGFVSSNMKNLIDRMLPVATMHLRIKDGQMRHYSRYNKMPDAVLLYTGEVDQDFMNLWLSRVQINFSGNSLGAFPEGQRKELYHALGCN